MEDFFSIIVFCVSICTLYLICNIIIAIFYKNPSKLDQDNIEYIKAPKVSVIVPAWNEAKGIAKTIKSIYNNGYLNSELIIVDDGSNDETYKIAKETCYQLWQKNPKIAYKVIKQKNMGKSQALNKGINNSFGKYILTIDADSRILPGTILNMVRALEKKKADVAIGKIIIGNTNNIISRSQSFEYLLASILRRAQNVLKSVYIFPGAITMFSRQSLKEIGSFNKNSITEDLDVSLKLKLNQKKVYYVESAVCVTEGAASFKGLLNQRIRWRHGYFQSVFKYNIDFVLSLKKGWYLSFVEIPFTFFMIIMMLFSPIYFYIIILFLLKNLFFSLFIIISYTVLISLILLLFNYINTTIKKEKKGNLYWLYFAFLPLFLFVINLVEFLAIAKTIYKIFIGQKVQWTVWQRTGAF